ncbi:MAG TPA: hypothetical protein VM661_05185 [Candidatus Sulfotelmatobacter sp.]|jgi:hypothetical protein|nr:hypothetical protein [Candidatus Sulfotelmatobacter sp.]
MADIWSEPLGLALPKLGASDLIDYLLSSLREAEYVSQMDFYKYVV